MTAPSARDRYQQLTAKVDAMFGDIYAARRADMQCGSGCSDCCHTRLSVTLIEASVVAEGLARASADTRTRLAERARSGRPGVCAALDDAGRCEIYEWRPLVCRSHGAPIRRAEPGKLPVIDVCFRNFRDAALDEVDAPHVFDQTTLSTVVGAIDAAFAAEVGATRGARIELAELLADPEQFFDIEADDDPT